MAESMHYTSANHAHQVMEQINQLRQGRELCDIILRCNNHRIAAHKLILSVNSPYFKSLMNNRYYNEPGLYEHRLPGIEGEALQQIVEFFYTSAVSVNDTNVWTLLPAASKLHVAEVQNLCSDYLLSQLQLENCLRIHKLATECLSSNLLKESTDFIKDNFEKLLEEDCFLELDFPDVMPHLKRLGDTGITNDQILQAIKCWIIAAVEDRQVYGFKIIRLFSNLASKLEDFIPSEYLEVDQDEIEHPLYVETGSVNQKRGNYQNEQKVYSSQLNQEKNNNSTLSNGAHLETLMCSECAEEFDTRQELEDHIRTHKVMIKKEIMSPVQDNQNHEIRSTHGSTVSGSLSPPSVSPSQRNSPALHPISAISQNPLLNRSNSPYEDFIKMNSLDIKPNRNMSRNLSYLSGSLKKPFGDDSTGSYFDNYMRARGLDSPSFGTRNTFSPVPSPGSQSRQIPVTVAHSAEDSNDHNFICHICNRSYLDKDSLDRHVATHSNFPCPVCGKTYSTKSNLQTHMKKHSDENIFKCKTCDKSFNSASVLKNHVRTHSGEKPFTCPTCGVAFAKNIHLKRHLSIHTGIKPHECHVCSKRFSRSDHLKRHVQSIHTQDRPHICSICGKDFVRKYELNKHLKQCHYGLALADDDFTQNDSYNDSFGDPPSQIVRSLLPKFPLLKNLDAGNLPKESSGITEREKEPYMNMKVDNTDSGSNAKSNSDIVQVKTEPME